MARLVAYAEDLSETSTTSSWASPPNKITMNADVVAGTTYLLLASYEISFSDTTTVGQARVRAAGSTRVAAISKNSDSTDYIWEGLVSSYAAGSTGSVAFTLPFWRNSGTGTVYLRNARLLVIGLGPNDAAITTNANASTTSTTFIDAQSLTWTPPATSDYLIFAFAAIGNGNTEVKLTTPGATDVNVCADTLLIPSNYDGWAAVWRETLAASSQTAAIKLRSTSGAPQNYQHRSIIAINLDDLYGAQAVQTQTPAGGTDTSYVATQTLSATGLAATYRDTVFIAAAAVSDNSSTLSSFADVTEAGTPLTETQFEGIGTTTRNRSSALLAYKVTSASGAIDWTIRRKSEGANTTTVEYSAMAVLEFPPPIEADAALTEADDSVSSAGTLLLRGGASITLDDDSVSAVIGITPVLADGAITEADDSVTSAGVLPILGSASITGDDDSLTAAGALFILGTGSALEDDDSVAAAAALLIQGGAAIDEGADLISAEGAILIVGAANIVEDDDSVVANDFVPRGRADLYEEDDFLRFHGGISAEWMQEQATKGDIPNWNHCARCHKEMRPNQLLAERRRVGSTVIWTGLRVCSDCLDPIHPQDRQPRVMGGDPRPVPNARPFRGS